MYQRLLYAMKRRILDETKNAFAEHPAYSEKVRVYNKFPYTERIQYGLVLRNASGSLIRLSPDNFMSDLYSLVRLAKQTTYPGVAIEWIRENAGNVTEIATEDVSDQVNNTQRRFFTAHPILAGKDNTQYADNPGQVRVTVGGVKVIPDSVSGESREVLLPAATDATVEILYYYRNIISPSINVVDFDTDNSFIVSNIYVIEEEILVSQTTGTETTVQLDHGGGTEEIDANSEDLYISYVDVEDTRLYTLKKGEDYSIDYTTGVVTFLQPLEKNYRIFVNYRYQFINTYGGPYSFKEFQENSEAIPGVVLSIGRRAKMGDQQVVIVTQNREQQAKIYGGHWDMSLELAVISKDPSQMEQMTDHIVSYLWSKRKNVLEYEGITLNSVEPGGESEEVHIDTTGDLYYESSVSISVQSEWQRFVPYNPIYKLRGISVLADTRSVLKSPVLAFEKLT